MNGLSHFVLEVLGWRFLLALGLATTLWARLALEQNPARTDVYPTEISVEAQNNESGVMVVGDLPAIKLRLSAPQESWRRLQVSSFRANVDLNRLGPGLHQVDVHVDVSDPQVRLLEKLPSKINVRLEPLKEARVAVREELTGNLPFGYVARPELLQIDPPVVTISGPETLVQRVTHALVAVRLDEARATIERTMRPEPRGSGGVVGGVRVEPQTVAVTLPVQQQSSWKDVSLHSNYIGQPAAGYWVAGVTVEPGFVQIVGEAAVIGQVQFLETDPVDVAGAQGDVVRSVTIRRPQGVALAREQPAAVRVAVQPVPSQQVRQVAVEIRGAAENLAASVAPPQVQVTLSGPAPVLARLEAGEVVATVNASALGNGSHTAAVTASAPDTVRVERVQPEAVTVTLAPR